MANNNEKISSKITWKHVIAVTGALGSGKTEFTMSLAKSLAQSGRNVTLADMDIINPYFCLRTVIKQLEMGNVSLLNPPPDLKWGDMSYINPAVRAKIYDASHQLILDVGGDSQGAFALRQFEPEIKEAGYDLVFVVNPYRVHTMTFPEIVKMKEKLEEIGGLNVTKIAANPHFMDKTTPLECAGGITKVAEFADKMGIPMLCGIAEVRIAEDVRAMLSCDIPLWILEREIMLPWESKRVFI